MTTRSHLSRHTRRENALSTLDFIELAFFVGLLAFIGCVVGLVKLIAPPMGKTPGSAGHVSLRLVEDEDDPEHIYPLGDLIGILS